MISEGNTNPGLWSWLLECSDFTHLLVDRVYLCYGAVPLLPRGTKTWQGQEFESTIDLVLALEELAANMIKCATLETDHGSDHQAIGTVFEVETANQQQPERLLFKNASWKQINARISENLEKLLTQGTVQQNTDRLMSVVCEAVRSLTPIAKPSPPIDRQTTSRKANYSASVSALEGVAPGL